MCKDHTDIKSCELDTKSANCTYAICNPKGKAATVTSADWVKCAKYVAADADCLYNKDVAKCTWADYHGNKTNATTMKWKKTTAGKSASCENDANSADCTYALCHANAKWANCTADYCKAHPKYAGCVKSKTAATTKAAAAVVTEKEAKAELVKLVKDAADAKAAVAKTDASLKKDKCVAKSTVAECVTLEAKLKTETATSTAADKAVADQKALIAKKWGGGATVGIIIGCVAGVLCIGGGAAWYIKHKKSAEEFDDVYTSMVDTEL